MPTGTSLGSAVGRLREHLVVLRHRRDERGHLLDLRPGHLVDEHLVTDERLGHGKDGEVEGHAEGIEARAAVRSESFVASEAGCKRNCQRVALTAVLAVEPLAGYEVRRRPGLAAGFACSDRIGGRCRQQGRRNREQDDNSERLLSQAGQWPKGRAPIDGVGADARSSATSRL